MLKISAFILDCTPPAGSAIGFGTSGKVAETIRDPLFLRCFILDDGRTRCVIASLDYGALMNSAQVMLRDALAQGASVPRDRVVVHCIHQHDAPLFDFELEKYLGNGAQLRDFWKHKCAESVAAAAKALGSMREVYEIGHRENRLYGYASNRRIVTEDGSIVPRYSWSPEPELKARPVGLIDPMLRTCAFRGRDGEIIATMSFYATHPQVANTGKKFSADAPGEAIRRVTHDFPDGVHAFFTGAGGNITAGKYTVPKDHEGNLIRFGSRLADSIRLNLEGMKWETPAEIIWRKHLVPFSGERMDRRKLEEGLAEGEYVDRLSKACLLTCLDNPDNAEYPVYMMRIASITLLFVAGEPFVEYQLYAQSLVADQFMALAANCCDNFLYLPLAENLREKGGYETKYFCWCAEKFETELKDTFKKLLLTEQGR